MVCYGDAHHMRRLQHYLKVRNELLFSQLGGKKVVGDISAWAHEILQGQGYVVLPELISTDQATEARSLVLQYAQAERQAGTLFSHEQRERLYGVIYKGEVFEQMVQHPTVMAIAEAILGVDMTLSGFSAHILQPGANCMGAHVDYPYFSLPQPYPAAPVLEIQAIWMLEDFTETNGAPMFAPGSQAFCHFPDPAKFQLLAKTVTGKAGSVVLSHGLCWHDTLPNTS